MKMNEKIYILALKNIRKDKNIVYLYIQELHIGTTYPNYVRISIFI